MLVAVTGVLPAIAGAGLQDVVDLAAILNALPALGTRDELRLRPRPDARRPIGDFGDASALEIRPARRVRPVLESPGEPVP
jgi:hypothetical protein